MKKHTTIITIICLLIAGSTFAQNHWRVNNAFGIDADFTEIQAAFDSATAGDIIYIEGTNIPYGNAISTKPFTIIGTGYFLAVNDSTQANLAPAIVSQIILNPGSEGTYVAGLTISNMYIAASNVIVERNNLNSLNIAFQYNVGNVVVRQNYINTISDQGYYSSVVIQNNIITYRMTSSVKANWLIYNNTFYSSYSSYSGLINVYNSAIKNNIVFNTQSSYPCINTDPAQNNNIEYNVCNKENTSYPVPENNIWTAVIEEVIVDEGTAEKMFYLIEGSPAIGYGENGVDCGAYGGLNPYILSGMPPVPHIFKASVPVSATSTSGLPVNVEIKSQK